MLAARSFRSLTRSGARPFSSTQARCIADEALRKLRERQDAFQQEDVDTYLKGTSKYHFYFTCAVATVIAASVCRALYRIGNKK